MVGAPEVEGKVTVNSRSFSVAKNHILVPKKIFTILMYHGNLHCEKLHPENRGRHKYSLIIRVSESKEMHYVHYCAGINIRGFTGIIVILLE